jgi:shikimate kinase
MVYHHYDLRGPKAFSLGFVPYNLEALNPRLLNPCPRCHMNVVLIGFRGSGKSTVGKRLAGRLRMSFMDTDEMIEQREGRSIREMVESRGWAHFRSIEKEIVRGISEGDGLVIASGGGAVVDPENVSAFKRNGFIVWLQADQEVLLNRVNLDTETLNRRPALTAGETAQEIEALIASRARSYSDASDIQVDTTSLDLETVVKRIMELLDQNSRV